MLTTTIFCSANLRTGDILTRVPVFFCYRDNGKRLLVDFHEIWKIAQAQKKSSLNFRRLGLRLGLAHLALADNDSAGCGGMRSLELVYTPMVITKLLD